MSISNATAAQLKIALDALQAVSITPDGSRVDYAALHKSREYAQVIFLTDALKTFNPASMTSRAEQLAFWINLYNALILDSVVRFGVKQSVTEGLLGVIRFFNRAAYIVGGQRISATTLEHGILRENKGFPFLPGPQFGRRDPRLAWVIRPMDARIHFALNCASISCPPIRFYDAAKLDQQLDLATRNFLASEVQIDMDNKQITLSEIFKWYAGDFGGKAGIISFLRRYMPDHGPYSSALQASDALQLFASFTWAYHKYDWGLNSVDHLTERAAIT